MAIQFIGGWLLPSKRPMDNMAAGWRLPQEERIRLDGSRFTVPSIAEWVFPGVAVPPDLNYLIDQYLSR
ncbi:MAG: hypothetical protein R3C05_00995 [Pirellulaceae bacterium]